MKQHLETENMFAHVFPDLGSVEETFDRLDLPDGFGMTLIGTGKGRLPNAAQLTAVLVHWGVIESDTKPSHRGLVLTSRLWLQHFRSLYEELVTGSSRVPARPRGSRTAMWTERAFLNHYPHYSPSSGDQIS